MNETFLRTLHIDKPVSGDIIQHNGTAFVNTPLFLSGSTTWNALDCADGAVVTTDVTVTGAALGDAAIVGYTSLPMSGSDSWLLTAFVSAADTVRVVLMNKSGANRNVGSGTVNVLVYRF